MTEISNSTDYTRAAVAEMEQHRRSHKKWQNILIGVLNYDGIPSEIQHDLFTRLTAIHQTYCNSENASHTIDDVKK